MGVYIVDNDLRLRFTQRVLDQVCDDDRDGTADPDVLERIIASGESFFESHVQATLGEEEILKLRALGGTPQLPHEVIRLCVECTEYQMFGRHPDYIRGQWDTRRQIIVDELKQFKLTELRIPPNADGDTAPVAHARGEGFVETGNPNDPSCPDSIFNVPGGGMGIFSPGGGKHSGGHYYG